MMNGVNMFFIITIMIMIIITTTVTTNAILQSSHTTLTKMDQTERKKNGMSTITQNTPHGNNDNDNDDNNNNNNDNILCNNKTLFTTKFSVAPDINVAIYHISGFPHNSVLNSKTIIVLTSIPTRNHKESFFLTIINYS